MKLYCVKCGIIADEEFFHTWVCRACTNARTRELAIMKKQQNIARACQELTKAINAGKSGARDIPAIVERFKAKVGGVEALADMLIEDFQRVRGEHLTEGEKLDFEFKDQVIQRYHQMLLSALEKNDETKVADMSQLSEEELKSIVTTVALEMIEKDQDFRESLVSQAIQEHPELLLNAKELFIDGEVTRADTA